MYITVDTQHGVLTERFIKWLCEELQIQPKVISVYGQDELDGAVGMCMDDSESEFTILVKTSGRDIGQVFNTIAHEMIHVKQYMKENLGYWMDNCSEIPYMERWWEVEAFSKSVPLVEKFAKTLK